MKSEPTSEMVARRIRTLRKARGWTLSDVESLSRGAISAVSLGSYERCDRAISLRRLTELADFFGVPLTHLLSEPKKSQNCPTQAALIIDLRSMKSISKRPENRNNGLLVALTALVTSIAHRRGDWNAEVMSLRQSDLTTLALMTMSNEEEIVGMLKRMKLLFTGPDRP